MKGTVRRKAALIMALAVAAGALACGCGDSGNGKTLRVGVRDDIMNFGIFK